MNLNHQQFNLNKINVWKRKHRCKNYFKTFLSLILFTTSPFYWVIPTLANTTGGTTIDNTATGSFEDPDNFGTKESDSLGASHRIVSGIHLGTNAPDAETDAATSLNATGGGAKDDGISLLPLIGGSTGYAVPPADITATGTGTLHAWADFDKNGTFNPTEHTSAAINSGTPDPSGLSWNSINAEPGTTDARFRYSTESDLGATGYTSDGEAKDYQIEIANSTPGNGGTCNKVLYEEDFGIGSSRSSDEFVQNLGYIASGIIPDFNYAVGRSSSLSGSWMQTNGNVDADGNTNGRYLGMNLFHNTGDFYRIPNIDVSEQDFLKFETALAGTCIGCNNVPEFTLLLKDSATGNTIKSITSAGIGVTNDGNWYVIEEQVAVPAGVTSVDFVLNNSQPTGHSGNDVGADNIRLTGIRIGLKCVDVDRGDAPDSYGTTSGNGGANHTIVDGIHLGTIAPDAEIDAATPLDGTGDDNDGTDDDDGISSFPSLVEGETSYNIPAANISATGTGTLHAWIDFDKNGTFEPSEYTSMAVSGGTPASDLDWTGITVGANGDTYARFRFTSDTSINANTPGGAASDGEVEDYQVEIATLGIYGRVFEDINYGGGAGRDFASSSGVRRPNVRVELYDSTGAFVAADNTDATGQYEFTSGITDGQSYSVRVVNDTVTSSRSLNAGFTTANTVAVQTYRYDPDETTPTVTNEVGGTQPALVDSGANTTSANLSTLTTATNVAQSVTTFTLSGAATDVDFGFNFDTIVNTNGNGQGSLRQFVSNSNALANTGLAQDLPSSITASLDKDGNAVTLSNYETSIFMIPDPNTDARVTAGTAAGQINLDTSPPDGGAGSAFVIDTSVSGTLSITDQFTSIDGRTQSVNIPTVSNIPNLTVGNNETSGAEVIIRKTSTSDILVSRASNTILHSIGVVGDDTSNAIGILFANNGNTSTQTTDTSNIIVDSVTVVDVGRCGVWGVQMVDSVIRDSVLRESGEKIICDNIQLRRNSDRNLIDNNLILRSEHYGIDIVVTGNSNNVITNNQIIGNGTKNADNQNSGIGLRDATGTIIRNNIIRDNIGDGVTVRVSSSPDENNLITQNSIYNNGGLGIDVGSGNSGDAPTPNDTGDGDSGPNLLQNYPVITSVISDATNYTIQGTLNSTSNSSFDIEIYSNAVCNPGIDGVAQTDDYGEGEKYHQTLSVNTDASGNATFSTTVPVADAAGTIISATATDANGNTSEFSQCPVASDPNVLLVKRITAINGNNFTSYIDDPNSAYDDNDKTIAEPVNPTDPQQDTENWPTPLTNSLIGAINGGKIKPDDEIEYTVYFLSTGDDEAKNVLVCDRIPENVTFLPGTFNSVTPATGGVTGSSRGIVWFKDGNTESLTNSQDGDAAQYFPPGVDPATVYPTVNCGGTNTNGAVVVNLGDLPNATAPGVPNTSYGYIRFRGKVK